MSEGPRPAKAQDELTDEVVAAIVLGITALVFLAILGLRQEWARLGVQLGLGVAFGGLMSISRRNQKALVAAPVLPFEVVLVRAPVLMLRSLGLALAMCLWAAFDRDFGLGGALWFSSMFAVSSALTAQRLRALQLPGERFVTLRRWARGGKIYRMPRTAPVPASAVGLERTNP